MGEVGRRCFDTLPFPFPLCSPPEHERTPAMDRFPCETRSRTAVTKSIRTSSVVLSHRNVRRSVEAKKVNDGRPPNAGVVSEKFCIFTRLVHEMAKARFVCRPVSRGIAVGPNSPHQLVVTQNGGTRPAVPHQLIGLDFQFTTPTGGARCTSPTSGWIHHTNW